MNSVKAVAELHIVIFFTILKNKALEASGGFVIVSIAAMH